MCVTYLLSVCKVCNVRLFWTTDSHGEALREGVVPRTCACRARVSRPRRSASRPWASPCVVMCVSHIL